jgi:glycosyltransferase involved in cell wall biosynthesis
MGAQQPVVMHLDTGREWRGGQQQAGLLLQGMVGRGWPAAMICPPRSALESWCGRQGLPCLAVWMGGEWNVLAGLHVAFLCREAGARIVHAHTSHAMTIALWARLFAPGLSVVATRRLDFHIGRSPLRRWKYANRGVAAVACVSEKVKSVLCEDGVPPEKLLTIHDGVDPGRFAGAAPALPGALASLAPGSLVIGTVAALVGHKDYPNLLRAARRVLDRRSDVTFVALGDGPLRSALEAEAAQLNLGERFVFAGFRDDVGAWLRRFDVFVLASREEGLGSSLLDAQALGIPVAATRAGGIPDVVTDGENGLLVPVGDAEALGDALLRLADSAALRARLGQAGSLSVRRFSAEVMVEKYLSLYGLVSPSATART